MANSVDPDQTEFTFFQTCQSQYLDILQEIKGNYDG